MVTKETGLRRIGNCERTSTSVVVPEYRPVWHGAVEVVRRPTNTVPYADVAADIKREIATDRAKIELNKRRDKIEDGFARLPPR